MKKNHLITALLLSFVNVLGFTILIPILPFIVEQYMVPQYFYGLLLSSYAAFQFLGAPVLGRLSDVYGRRKTLIVSHLGTLLSWGLFAVAYFLPNTNLWWGTLPILVIGSSRILDGITAGNTSVVSAYISDVTTRKERNKVFGQVGAVTGAGLIIGPAIGGFTAELGIGYLGTIISASIISILALLFIIFRFEETLKHTKNTIDWGEVLRSLNIVATISKYSHKENVFSMLIFRFFFYICMIGYTSIVSLYVIDLFSFSESQLGFFLFIIGLYLIINQLFLVHRMISHIGQVKGLVVGSTLLILGLPILFLANTPIMFLVLSYPINLGISIIIPTVKTFLSQKTSDKDQGEILGLDESLRGLSQAIMPTIGTILYTAVGYTYFGLLSVFLSLGIGFMYLQRNIT